MLRVAAATAAWESLTNGAFKLPCIVASSPARSVEIRFHKYSAVLTPKFWGDCVDHELN